MVPSASASRQACRSASVRSGGESLKKVRYSPMSFSFSVRCAAETPQVTAAPGAWRAHDVEAFGGGQQRGVVARPGHGDEADVAFERHGLGLDGDALEPEPGRDLARGHDAVADEIAVLEMMADERVEGPGVGEKLRHHACARDRAAARREGDRAGGLEEADLGHLAALIADGRGRHRRHMHERGVARAPADEVDDGDVVHDRIGVGHGDDGRDPARSRGAAGRAQGFAVFEAGFADEDAHVDEARAEHVTLGLDHLRAGRQACERAVRPERRDPPVLDQAVAGLVAPARGVDQARGADVERARHAFGRWRASASRTAMRTATPIST